MLDTISPNLELQDVEDVVLQRLIEADVVGIDVETSGLDPRRCFICGYVFTFGPRDEDTYYVPVRHQGGGNVRGARTPRDAHDYEDQDVHSFELKLRVAVRSKKRLWYGHNIKFDMHMLARHKIYLYGDFEDTMVNAALLDENQGKYGLDDCCKVSGIDPKLADIYQYISDFMKRVHNITVPATKASMGYFWMTPAKGMSSAYAKQDGVSTAQLREHQRREIEAQDLVRVHAVEMRVTRALFRMESRGIPVDMRVLELVKERVHTMLREAKEALPEGFNVRSAPQVKQLFLDRGWTTDQFRQTEKAAAAGKDTYSFTEDWLLQSELGRMIIVVRKYSNLINTFITGAIESNVFEGKIYCTFNQLKGDEFGTVTGRLSCSHPNLQQIPKRDKILAPLLRQIFQEKDRHWHSADFSSQEYRVFSEYAQAKLVLEAYARDPNTDYHQLVADLLGVERDPTAKRINLGVLYRMGVSKLALSLGISVDLARGYMNKMRRMMPEAAKFNDVAEKVATSRGYVKTLLGRRRRFPRGEFVSKAGNAVIQGSSADITKLAMVECDEFLMGDPMETDVSKSAHKSELVLQIHDSLEFLVAGDEEEAIDRCMRMMVDFGPGRPIELKVPMKVDVGIGDSWGRATFGDKYTGWL